MSQIRLLTVGKPRDARMAALVTEYLQRLKAGFSVTWDVVPEVPFKRGGEQRTIKEEQERLQGRIALQDLLILLDIQGQMVDSPALAVRLSQWRDMSRPIVVVVGGSLGVGPAVKSRSYWQWSLSPLTLPHGLAQVVAVEQLYRAWTILQEHPYHK